MNPLSAATVSTVSTASQPMHLCACQCASDRHGRFHSDIKTVSLRHGGKFRTAAPTMAIPVHRDVVHRQLPILSARRVSSTGAPKPAVDFAFFREPLKQNPALIDKWGAAAKEGSQSEAWSQFVTDVSERFFKGSRKQRVMDALVLSLDILPVNRRADALACLLDDGSEGRAAAEEFWKYVGMDRIPDSDKPRVAELIRRYEIGM